MQAKLVSLIVATLGVGGAPMASAADLLVKAPPPVVFSWAGFYAGVNAGFTWGNTTTTDILATNGLCWVSCGAKWSTALNGFTGGGQAGYNLQFGNLVVGVEGDLGYLGASGTGPYPLLRTTTANTDGGVFSTARARLGVNVDHVLIYGTGGWFGANLDSSVHQNVGVVINTSSTGFQSGWTAGGGVEWAFAPRWSLKGEYLHYDVGDKEVGGTFTGGGAAIQFFNVKNTGEIVRGGVNYHF